MGFPPGVAEELVLKVLKKCDPKNWSVGLDKETDINNEIMCSTVAQEVEVIADDEEPSDGNADEEASKNEEIVSASNKKNDATKKDDRSIFPEDYEPPVIVTQKNSESYNGAMRDKYSWSQTIMDLGKLIDNLKLYKINELTKK